MAETSGKRLQCVIVTPEKAVLDTTVESAVIPLFDGEFGVLPDHEPFVGRLAPGELRLAHSGTVQRLYIDSGFAQFRANVLTVLTSQARQSDELALDKATSELQAAESMPVESTVQIQARALAMDRARAKLRIIDKVSGSKA